MRRWTTAPAAVSAILLLVGCKDPVRDARDKMRFLQNNGGTLGEVCDAGRQLLNAKAEARDSRNPEDRPIVDVSCMTAEMKGRDMPANQDDPAYGVTADNLDAPAGNEIVDPEP